MIPVPRSTQSVFGEIERFQYGKILICEIWVVCSRKPDMFGVWWQRVGWLGTHNERVLRYAIRSITLAKRSNGPDSSMWVFDLITEEGQPFAVAGDGRQVASALAERQGIGPDLKDLLRAIETILERTYERLSKPPAADEPGEPAGLEAVSYIY